MAHAKRLQAAYAYACRLALRFMRDMHIAYAGYAVRAICGICLCGICLCTPLLGVFPPNMHAYICTVVPTHSVDGAYGG